MTHNLTKPVLMISHCGISKYNILDKTVHKNNLPAEKFSVTYTF